MVSSHFPFTYGHQWNWAILIGLSIIGAGTRHWFNLRGQRRRNVWLLPVAAAGIITLALVTVPDLGEGPEVVGEVSYTEG